LELIYIYINSKAIAWRFLRDFPSTKQLFLKNSDIFRGFSFNKVLIFQESGQRYEIFLYQNSYFSKIQAKLGHFPLRKTPFSGNNI
jgi:hypothetical protein